MARVQILCWYRRHAHLAHVPIIVCRTRHERLVRQHQTYRQAQRRIVNPGTPSYPLVVDEIHRRLRDILVMHLVRRLPASGEVQTDTRRTGRAVQHPVVNTLRTAGMIRTVVANISACETVQLVRTVEMHPASLHRIVSRRAKRVGIRRNGRTQHLVVSPDLRLMRVTPSHQRGPRRHADRRRAVRRSETRTGCSQSVQVRRANYIIAGTTHHDRTVLVRLDIDDVRRAFAHVGWVPPVIQRFTVLYTDAPSPSAWSSKR